MPNPIPDPLPPSTDRRSFLLGAALPLAAGLGPTRPRDDAEDLAAAARLAGLEFTAEERAQAGKRLAGLRAGYAAVRQSAIPFELPPCAAFDPLPPGRTRAPATGRVPFPIPADTPRPATDQDLAFATIPQLASLLRRKQVTSLQLVDLALARLQQFDPQLFCVVHLRADAARAEAKERDAELAAGKDRGPLHGIPYGAKDLFGWPGTPTSFGAAPWRDFRGLPTATCLQKLADAGAVLVAKLALGALAMGDLWHGGRTRNPWNPQQGSSGSSAGPASAVAAGLVPFAIGTETLGSIVSPCRQCGVGGLRPTFGTVSRHGAMPLSWTMDKVGPIARSAVDLALVFDAMRGKDGLDPAAVDVAFPWRPAAGLQGLAFGLVQQGEFPTRPDDKTFVQWLEGQGVKLTPVTLPPAPLQGMLAMLHAEAAAAFDDALRQGLLPQLPGQGDSDWPAQFRAARAIPAVEYLQASRARTALLAAMDAAFANVDVVVAPTHGGPMLTATNLSGHPTCVLPVGRGVADGGRPTVLALVGKLYGEAALLATAEAWQATTDHHLGRPALTR